MSSRGSMGLVTVLCASTGVRAEAPRTDPTDDSLPAVTAVPLPDERSVPAAVPQPPVPMVRETADLPRETLVARTRAAVAAEAPEGPGAFRPGVYLGGTLGLGSPASHVVAGLAGLQMAPWVSLEISGGLGEAFGPSVAGGARLYPVQGRGWALSVAGVYSVNFTPGGGTSTGDPNDPATSRWVSAELAGEFRSAPGLGLRVALGWTWLANTRDFGSPSTPAAAFHTSGPAVDLPDARAHALEGTTLGFIYVHLDYVYHLPF